jgi:hypothetical protein
LSRHDIQHRARAVRPALQKDAVVGHVTARPQISQRAFGIEGANRALIDVVAVRVIMREPAETMPSVSGAETVGQQSEKAAIGPIDTLRHVSFGERRGVARRGIVLCNERALLIDIGRIRPPSAMQHHDRRVRTRGSRRKQIAHQLRPVVGAGKVHRRRLCARIGNSEPSNTGNDQSRAANKTEKPESHHVIPISRRVEAFAAVVPRGRIALRRSAQAYSFAQPLEKRRQCD